jgi:phosphoribosyl 1,2-cyclic phosphate phosphodiesterase
VLGFRIGKMAYLTDFNSFPNTELEKLKNLDVLIINALRREPHVSHFTLDEALSVISEVKPVHAYLTHVSHQMGRYSDVEKLLPDNVIIAYDGLSLVL